MQAALAHWRDVWAMNVDILAVLRQHDPAAVAARQGRIIHRYRYNVTEGMVLWHMDSRLPVSAAPAK